MELPHILLEVQVVNSDLLELPRVVVHLDVAVRHDREVALAGLVALRQVRVEVGLAEEQGGRLYRTVERHARQQPLLDDTFVESYLQIPESASRKYMRCLKNNLKMISDLYCFTGLVKKE